MMSPTCVLIVGPARSGTSITAAVCQELGVQLPADSIGPHSELNPFGHFESKAWRDLNRELRDQGGVPTRLQQERYARLVQRDMRGPVWGVKDPAFCYTLGLSIDHVRSEGSRVAVVAAHRPFRPTAHSRARHSAYGDGPAFGRQEAEDLQVAERAAFYASLNEATAAGIAVHHADYDQLVDNTMREVDRLAEFIWGDHYDAQVVEQAAALVAPDLRHFGGRPVPTLPWPRNLAVLHG